MSQPDHFENYRPTDQRDLGWGVRLDDAGYTYVKPGMTYPPYQHPDAYMFTWEKGRRLDIYQIVFIGRGRGVLETEHGGIRTIEAGSVFLLFPGEWHRYRPDPSTGWSERWCGFSGFYADQIMRTFFSLRHPVLRHFPACRIRSRLRRLTRLLSLESTIRIPTLVGEVVGLLTELAPYAKSDCSMTAVSIARACDVLLAAFRENIDLKALAEQFGMSYAFFRREFKRQTGFAPHAYVLAARLNFARSLLSTTTKSITAIARETGFSSLPYFTRIFTRQVGCTPNQWRQHKTPA